MTDASFRFNRAAFDAWVNQPSGPVAADLTRRALQVVAEEKRLLSQPGQGAVYGRHRASAPGDPPAVDTGQLRASIGHRLGRDARGIYAFVGTKLAKARHLEFGTSRMAPRPSWLQALRKAGGRR